MKPVRKHMKGRLESLSIRVLYKDPIKIYVISHQMLYQVCYNKLDASNYDGLIGIVMIDGDEIVLCKLKQCSHYDLQYEAKELPIVFARCPVRTLQIDFCNIMGYLLPCLEK